jgi:transposase
MDLLYSEKELQFLKDNYLTMKNKDMALSLNRSLKSIERKLSKMGLHRQQWHLWTEPEIKFLKDNHDKMSRIELGEHLGRQGYNVGMKMTELGLTTPFKKWTVKDIEFLKENYQHISLKEIAAKLNTSQEVIRHKATKLGLIKYKDKNNWNAEDINYLKENKDNVKRENMSEKLKCSLQSINKKITELEHIENEKKYIKFIEVNYDKITYDKMAGKLNITESIILSLIKKCNLPKSKGGVLSSWNEEDIIFLKENAIIKLTYKEISEKLNKSVEAVKQKSKQVGYNKQKYLKMYKERRFIYRRLQSIFKGIRTRCYDSRHRDYVRYGARGITVYDEWLKSPKLFNKFALDNGWKPGLSTDRIDPYKGYVPSNIRFITKELNSRYTRNTILNDNLIKQILDLYCLQNINQITIAKQLCVSCSTISSILHKKTWKNIVEKWEEQNKHRIIIKQKINKILSKEERLKRIFYSIQQRCYNPNSSSYKRYGGRGITIYQPWLDKPELFIQFALEYGWKEGLHTNRIDNEKGYFPYNINFITFHENQQNKSKTVLDKDMVYKILDMHHLNNMSRKAVAKELKLSTKIVSDVINNRTWTNISSLWKSENL